MNDLKIIFMKYNWLKPISVSLNFEFEVDPYMEWLYCILPWTSQNREFTFLSQEIANLIKGHFYFHIPVFWLLPNW